MKNSIKILSALFIIFAFMSCSRDAAPTLEIYVSAKKSNTYRSISMNHGYIRIFHKEGGAGNIQQYSGVDIEMDLSQEVEPILVANESHWEGSFAGLNASLGNINVIGVEGNELKARPRITASNDMFGPDFELIANKRYRIDFVYDVDESIVFEHGGIIFDTVVEVTVEEL